MNVTRLGPQILHDEVASTHGPTMVTLGTEKCWQMYIKSPCKVKALKQDSFVNILTDLKVLQLYMVLLAVGPCFDCNGSQCP